MFMLLSAFCQRQLSFLLTFLGKGEGKVKGSENSGSGMGEKGRIS